jgi:hypothetical protein
MSKSNSILGELVTCQVKAKKVESETLITEADGKGFTFSDKIRYNLVFIVIILARFFKRLKIAVKSIRISENWSCASLMIFINDCIDACANILY